MNIFFFFCGRGGEGGGEEKTNIQFVSFLYGSSSKAITRFALRQPSAGASETGSLREEKTDGRTDGRRQEKHLLGCPSEAPLQEALVHIPQQEKQLGLRVSARRTLEGPALARFLRDVGERAARDFGHDLAPVLQTAPATAFVESFAASEAHKVKRSPVLEYSFLKYLPFAK